MKLSEFNKSNEDANHPCYLCRNRIIHDNKYCNFHPKYEPHCIMLVSPFEFLNMNKLCDAISSS